MWRLCFPQHIFLLISNSRKLLSDVMLQNAPGVESQQVIRMLNVLFDMYDGFRSVVNFYLQSHSLCGRKTLILLEQHSNLTWSILQTSVGFDEIFSSTTLFLVLPQWRQTHLCSRRKVNFIVDMQKKADKNGLWLGAIPRISQLNKQARLDALDLPANSLSTSPLAS